MLSRDDVLGFWQNRFGSPLGRPLTAVDPATVRFHSLPGGDQYPRCYADKVELLKRQNSILSSALGEGMPYAQILTDWGSDDCAADEAAPFLALEPYDPLAACGEDADDGTPPMLYWTPLIWRPGSQDHLLLAVADERLAGVSFVSVGRRCAVFPYDGGIDVVARDTRHAQDLAAEFSAWLPNADESDPTRVIRASCSAERNAVELLIMSGASIYLDDKGYVTLLKLASRRVTDDLLVAVASLSRVAHLHLQKEDHADKPSPSVSDRGLAQLAKLEALEFLRLACFPRVTASALQALQAALPPLCDVCCDERDE